MKHLLLNPHSKKLLEQFILQPSHTIALIGETGTGKGAVAAHLAASLLSLPIDKLETCAYFRLFKPDKGTISIETAREIIGLTKLKTTGTGSIRRVIIIEDAQTLTTEAQNALLKTFEEPPADTVFILTITNLAHILPTVLSRFQVIPLQHVEQSVAVGYFVSAGYTQDAVVQYHHMSGGRPGLLHALLTNSDTHPLIPSIQKAKLVLQADSFERLTMVDELVKQKQAHEIVAALSTISRSALYIEAGRTNTNDAPLKRWAGVLEKTEEAKNFLNQNAQPKLVLTSLFLEI